MALIDPGQQTMARMNTGFLKLLGRTVEKVQGRPISKFLHLDDRHALAAALSAGVRPDLGWRDYCFLRRDGRPVWIRAMASPARRTDVADAYRFEVALALETRQVREFSYRLPGQYDPREISARIVASGWDKGLAVVRDVTLLRSTQRKIHEVEERNRRRLGQDLHDGLGQDLTDIALKCSALARGLFPVGLEGCGLAEHLRRMALHVRETFGIRCDIRWDPKLEDTADLRVTDLYWILHEATTHAIRHGAPKRIRLIARAVDGGARFSVWNDDRPFEAAPGGEGMGLDVMKARAMSLGASLSTDNLPKGGVEVSCTLNPWGPPAAPVFRVKPSNPFKAS